MYFDNINSNKYSYSSYDLKRGNGLRLSLLLHIKTKTEKFKYQHSPTRTVWSCQRRSCSMWQVVKIYLYILLFCTNSFISEAPFIYRRWGFFSLFSQSLTLKDGTEIPSPGFGNVKNIQKQKHRSERLDHTCWMF